MTTTKPVSQMSDAEVLRLTNNGALGPAIVGQELADRARRIAKENPGGRFGPAILNHPGTARPATPSAPHGRQETPPRDEDNAPPKPLSGPEEWAHVTLSGAKVLAQRAGVSYTPRVKRVELIEQLIAAKIAPPAKAEPKADDDEAED